MTTSQRLFQWLNDAIALVQWNNNGASLLLLVQSG
jgi:hypothetical protein